MTNRLVRRVKLTGATPLPILSRKGRGRNNQLLAMTLRLVQRYWGQGPLFSVDFMQFNHPGWFLLLVLVPVPLILERARPRILWPSFAELPPGQRRRSGRLLLRFLPAILRGLALGALALALARPQTVGGVIRIAGQGLAIVVALDQSSSMNTADFPVDQATRRISRLEAAKATFTSLVEGR